MKHRLLIPVLIGMLIAPPVTGIAHAGRGKKLRVPSGRILKKWGSSAKERYIRQRAVSADSAAQRLVIAPENELELGLTARLDELVSRGAMGRAVTGVYVWDLRTGRPLYAHGAERQLNPASNVKLVSTAAVIDALGADHRFPTRVIAPAPDGAGVVDGNLAIVGSGDPLLAPVHLHGLAVQVAGAGVRRISGDIVVGSDAHAHGMGAQGLRVTVAGASSTGAAPSVALHPASTYFRVVNRATTDNRRRRPRLNVDLAAVTDAATGQPLVEIRISGQVRAGQVVHRSKSVPNAPLYTAHTLAGYLALEGVELGGRVRVSDDAPVGAELARHESDTVAELAGRVNKPSWNWLADRLVAAAGSAMYGGSPSMEKGLALMKAYLAQVGVDVSSVRLDNGSGLSYTNHLSARQIVQVMVAAVTASMWGAEYLTSLAVGDVDGTLRSRFADCRCRGWVRGKTGTLTSVSALSGFVSAGPNNTLAFAIVTNGFHRRRVGEVRRAHDLMVSAMRGYLLARDRQPAGPPPPPAAEPVSALSPLESPSL